MGIRESWLILIRCNFVLSRGSFSLAVASREAAKPGVR